VDGCVREGNPGELGLEAVDQMAEDPAATTGAEAVARLLAEPAAPARRDAGDQHAVAGKERRNGVADLDHGSDGFVAEDPARLDLRNVALEDVQVGSADRRGVDADDRVRRGLDPRVGHGFPRALTWPVVHEGLHGSSSLR
jgi:hypothetical protein